VTPLQREALQMCLEYIETDAHERRHVRWKINEALAQPQQEPVLLNGLTEAETNSTASVVGLTLNHAPCLGMDCGITRTDQIHSAECQAEHAAAIAGGKFVKPAQPQQEPVAYWIPKAEQFCIADPSGRPFVKAWEPLYASPQSAQRKPLTDEEMYLAIRPLFRTDAFANAALELSKDEYQAIEAAHGIKGDA